MNRPKAVRVMAAATTPRAVLGARHLLGLLLSQPVATYIAAKTAMSWVVTGGGVAISAWWFKRSVRLQPAPVPVPVAIPATA